MVFCCFDLLLFSSSDLMGSKQKILEVDGWKGFQLPLSLSLLPSSRQAEGCVWSGCKCLGFAGECLKLVLQADAHKTPQNWKTPTPLASLKFSTPRKVPDPLHTATNRLPIPLSPSFLLTAGKQRSVLGGSATLCIWGFRRNLAFLSPNPSLASPVELI